MSRPNATDRFKVELTLATPEQTDAIVMLGHEFHARSRWKGLIPFVEADARSTVEDLIAGKHGYIVVATIEGRLLGMASAMLMPMYWNKAELVAVEMFMYVDPSLRSTGIGGHLVEAMEDVARQRGASMIIMSALAGVDLDRFAASLARRGYAALENNFARRL